jgi:hypothetical protein
MAELEPATQTPLPCPVCKALVRGADMQDHQDWHEASERRSER